MEKIEKYDISKLDIFELSETTRRNELCNLHSILLFLYSKRIEDKPDVFFKYSEIDWMDKRIVRSSVETLNTLGLITLVNLPTRSEPFRVALKSNDEVNAVLNRNKKLSFEKYDYKVFSKSDFSEAIGCKTLREHFLLINTTSWIKNINNGVWDLSEFLILCKIISCYSCENKIKTYTLQKYMAIKGHFIINKVRFLYGKVPTNRKDILITQLQNTLRDLKIKNDGSFEDMVKKYQKKIKEPSVVPPSSTTN